MYAEIVLGVPVTTLAEAAANDGMAVGQLAAA
jgi:hypothetical protein